jgi:hypothetical protein
MVGHTVAKPAITVQLYSCQSSCRPARRGACSPVTPCCSPPPFLSARALERSSRSTSRAKQAGEPRRAERRCLARGPRGGPPARATPVRVSPRRPFGGRGRGRGGATNTKPGDPRARRGSGRALGGLADRLVRGAGRCCCARRRRRQTLHRWLAVPAASVACARGRRPPDFVRAATTGAERPRVDGALPAVAPAAGEARPAGTNRPSSRGGSKRQLGPLPRPAARCFCGGGGAPGASERQAAFDSTSCWRSDLRAARNAARRGVARI